MEHYGQVMGHKGDKIALVKVRQNLSCENCGRCAGFFGDPEKREDMLVEVINPIGAQKGELVRLEARASEMLLAAFLLYLFPLIGMVTGIFAGRSLAINGVLSGSPDIWGLGIGFVLMAGIFLFLRFKEKKLRQGQRFKAVITSVVDESEIPDHAVPN